jgi:hypothetical protein
MFWNGLPGWRHSAGRAAFLSGVLGRAIPCPLQLSEAFYTLCRQSQQCLVEPLSHLTSLTLSPLYSFSIAQGLLWLHWTHPGNAGNSFCYSQLVSSLSLSVRSLNSPLLCWITWSCSLGNKAGRWRGLKLATQVSATWSSVPALFAVGYCSVRVSCFCWASLGWWAYLCCPCCWDYRYASTMSSLFVEILP